jgi:peptidylprolyl isomerase
MIRPIVCALAIAALAAGCDDPTGPADPMDLTYAASLNVSFARMTQTSTGLWYEDVVVGTGPAVTAGDRVRVLYFGWLPNGTLFDSNQDPEAPLQFRVGLSQVIAGWDEGLLDMRPGGTRKLIIRPGLAYGHRASETIPGNSTLVFDVTLLGYQ